VYVWGETPPVACPNGSDHSIDANTITIVDSVSDKVMNISQDHGLTGGNFRSETLGATIKPNTTETFDFAWPFDISVHTVHFITNAQHIGDVISCVIAPNTVIGYITSVVGQGDNTINVSPTVIQYTKKGYIVSLFDGQNKSSLGMVTGQDVVNGTITCSIPSSSSFDPLTPTYVMLEVRNINQFRIGDPNEYSIGASLIQSGLIPANTVVQLEYKNNSKTDAKYFSFFIEYFY
jgi:hypothetical protein